MYFRILLVFAIALFACISAILKFDIKVIDIQKNALLLSPYLVLSWFAGYLFLYWNYEVVITEMDCIAHKLQRLVGIEEESLLSHKKFLDCYTLIGSKQRKWLKLKYFLYVVIGMPALITYVYLTYSVTKKYLLSSLWVLFPYIGGLIVIPILCIIVHILFVQRIGEIDDAGQPASTPSE